ncbi:MAG: pseudaminic acid cytidylyltransferase [Crocinitomicaceae bacterium]|nr:pseudaminic acid cytidylyltransferase [Crocinitomicaceae bacterium]
MTVAIIPARGGSKRIPRKNIQLFHGKPIIAYAIETAIESGLFSRIIVSTDDEEIAQIAKNNGAEVPFLRSTENADDFATTSSVLIEVLDQLSSNGESYTSACCIYPTSPLIDSKDLKHAHDQFITNEYDVLISCVAFSFPIQRSFHLNDGSMIELNHPDVIHQRSQDLTKNYHDAGAMYFFNVQQFKASKSLWSGKIGAYELSELKVQDIDTLEDWKIAELKYSILHP